MVVLVTGANGQLGQSLQSIAENHPEIEFVFCDSKRNRRFADLKLI